MAHNEIYIKLDVVEQIAFQILTDIGFSNDLAQNLATVIRLAERDGPKSHGLAMLAYYKTCADAGKIELSPEPSYSAPRPGMMVVNCDNSFTQLGLSVARNAFINMVKEQGVAVLVTQKAHHIAALRHDVLPLAEAGFITLMMSGSRPWVVPHGGERSVFGTNPMAFACPRPNAPPIVWDQAVSMTAISDVRLAEKEGKVFSQAVGLNTNGMPSCEPSELIEAERLYTYGEHKGTAIALMIEIMAAGLTGGRFAIEHSTSKHGPTNPTGQTIIAIDPNSIQSGFTEHLERLLTSFEDNSAARIPGDGRLVRAQQAKNGGVHLPIWLLERLNTLGWTAPTQ